MQIGDIVKIKGETKSWRIEDIIEENDEKIYVVSQTLKVPERLIYI